MPVWLGVDIYTDWKLPLVIAEVANDTRLRIASLLKKVRAPHTNIMKEESQDIGSLRNNPDLIILPADKGYATVVLDKEAYDTKLREMLSDQ